LLYLYRIECLTWLPKLCSEVWTPQAVVQELEEGTRRGYDVPNPHQYAWLKIVNPNYIPSEWLTLDLGAGELASIALALENPNRIIILDDALARRVAKAAGIEVWGCLRVLLEAKSQGLTTAIAPLIERLIAAGLWVSEDIRERVLRLAKEK
jgi:predicted nucleic acid-binding protein